MRGLRPALRIARREAVRSKGRSALVVAMIGLPMMGLAFADVAIRTAQLPPAEAARRELGAADLIAEQVADGPIVQRGLWDVSGPTEVGPSGDGKLAELKPRTEADVLALLPPGSRVAPQRTTYATKVRAGERAAVFLTQHIDLDDPVNAGVVRLREGSAPDAPEEAAVTVDAARQLRLRVGDPLEIAGTPRRVSGIVTLPNAVQEQAAFVLPSVRLPGGQSAALGVGDRWAVALPPGVRDLDLMPALNRAGFRVSPRTWYFDPPPDPYAGSYVDVEAIGVAVVAVGLATLEIVLLAGTAFAVGARRRQRELALVAATGGDRKDVRRVVLAGGVVLGVVAGVLGVAGGIAAVVLARPWLDTVAGSLLGPLDVRPLELAAIVLVAVVTGLLAALLPARAAARQQVVAALTGRRGDARARARVPYLPILAIVAGAALAFWAAGDGYVPDDATLDVGDLDRMANGRPARFNLLLTGAVVAELGFVACAPALVAVVGRLARRLPLPLRLAARDAARHRTRSGPAVAAVVAAVAGSVAVSVYLASDTEKQRRAYEPRLPTGAVWIAAASDGPDGVSDSELAAAAAKLPVRERVAVGQLAGECQDGPCGMWRAGDPGDVECAGEIRCFADRPPGPGNVLVGDAALLSWWTGRDDGAEQLKRGNGVVVLDKRWLRDGKLVLEYDTYTPRASNRTVALPAVAVAGPGYMEQPSAVITPAAARAHGLDTMPYGTLLLTARTPTTAEEAAARGILTANGEWTDLYVERGFRRQNAVALLALGIASSVVTVGATGIATGLAAADSRPDLATLAAVGAAPRVRRRLAMAQAATVAALGSVLGILAGLVPAIAIVGARAEVPLEMPWAALATTAVGVPLLAALVIGGCTRSRLPLARRLA